MYTTDQQADSPESVFRWRFFSAHSSFNSLGIVCPSCKKVRSSPSETANQRYAALHEYAHRQYEGQKMMGGVATFWRGGSGRVRRAPPGPRAADLRNKFLLVLLVGPATQLKRHATCNSVVAGISRCNI